jgi:hypothetical protein
MTEQLDPGLDPGLDLGEAPVWRLSPATAVRRRGEDRVRRRRGLATGLAGLATAVTVLGTAALTGPAGSGPVAIATAPGAGVVTAGAGEPAGSAGPVGPVGSVDLAAGMSDRVDVPDALPDDPDVAVRIGPGCWVAAQPGVSTLWSAAAPGELRVVWSFPDVTAARAAFAVVERGAEDCGTTSNGELLAVGPRSGAPSGDESWTLAVSGPNKGTEAVSVVRVGDVVLLDAASRPDALEPGAAVAWLAGRTGPVVARLCRVAGRSCGG